MFFREQFNAFKLDSTKDISFIFLLLSKAFAERYPHPAPKSATLPYNLFVNCDDNSLDPSSISFSEKQPGRVKKLSLIF